MNEKTEKAFLGVLKEIEMQKKNKLTAREFYEKYLQEEMTLEEALSILSAYTGKGAGYYTQFPDADLALAGDEDDYVDFLVNFQEYLDHQILETEMKQ